MFAARVLVVAAMASLLTTRAFADAPSDADRALARELGSAGFAALDAQDYTTALDRLSRAIALYDVPTLRLGRARALRGMGRLVSASENYRAILLRTPMRTDPPPFVQATRDAKRELPDVEAHIAHLTVVLSTSPAALRVDGVEWPAAALGVPRPLDPGEHLVEAFTSALQVQSQRVTLGPGQDARIELTLLPPPKEAHPGAEALGALPPLVSVAPAASAPAPTGNISTQTATAAPVDRTAAYAMTAVSGALAAGAIITGIVASAKKSEFDEQNRAEVPRATKDDLRGQANTMAVVSTILTGAAIVGAGVSVYIWVAPRRTERRGQAAQVNTGLSISGSF